jgi:hypothetical protein
MLLVYYILSQCQLYEAALQLLHAAPHQTRHDGFIEVFPALHACTSMHATFEHGCRNFDAIKMQCMICECCRNNQSNVTLD